MPAMWARLGPEDQAPAATLPELHVGEVGRTTQLKRSRLERRTPLKAREGLVARKAIRKFSRNRFATTKQKRAVFERAQGYCAYGQEFTSYEDGVAEHWIPKGRGGQTDMDNLVWACRAHNADKGNRTGEEYVATLARPD